MKQLRIMIAVLATTSAKSIDINPSQVQPIESIGIKWSQVQSFQDTDQYWVRLPAEMQYLRKQEPDRRIVNGQKATPGQFPYQVFSGTSVNWVLNSSCGGSNINSNNVLTAAHCVWRALSGTAIVGVHNNKLNVPTQQRIPYAKVFYLADYNADTLKNDIAIVRLSSHITFNPNVQPVRLPAQGDNRHCYGDSGGPVLVNDSESALQVGVFSFVHGDGCNAGFPSVSARVTYCLDWILHVMTL